MENKDEKNNAVNMAELAKWGSAIMAGIAGTVLLSDWFYTVNYYGALGVVELARPSFLATPLHFSGFLSLWIGLQMVGAYCLFTALLINILVKPILKLIPRKFHIVIILFFAILILVETVMVQNDMDTSSFSPEIIAVMPFLPAAPVVVLLWFFVEHYIKESATRNSLFLVLILVSANFFLLSFVVKFSAASGVSEGEKIIRGEKYLPIVALVTKEKVGFSDKVTASQTDDGRWLYYPQSINNPQTGKTIVTMQFVGADDNNLYILDLWGSSVHAIPKDNISEVIYLNFSDTALINSSRNPIFSATPTPTP